MLSGSSVEVQKVFLLGIDDTAQRERDQSILRLAVARTDANWIRTIAAEESKAIISAANGQLDLVKGHTSTVPLRLAARYFGVPGPDIDTRARVAQKPRSEQSSETRLMINR